MDRRLVDKREVSATSESRTGSNSWLVAPGVWRLKDLFVNIFLIQNSEGTEWVLVDTGLVTSASKIRKLVADTFGAGSKPKAIIMTHGHFDHRGAVEELAGEWGVPVYCHHQERPYLTGKASYPPADPAVGGGMMSLMSFTYPKGPIDIVDHLEDLVQDGKGAEDLAEGPVPELSDWKWIHTPGHTPGHISLFREKDGVLIAGDAFVTTVQESVLAVITQKQWVCGPPKYFTPDWISASRSVRALAALEPNVIVSGHGSAMYGDEARKELHKLSREFWKLGMPAQGRYVKEAATFDADGLPTHIPSGKGIMLKRIAIAAGLFAIGYLIMQYRKKHGGIEAKIADRIGKHFMGGSYVALGATAPASPAMPSLPVIPAI